VALAQLVVLGIFTLEPILAMGAVFAFMLVTLVLDRPLWGVCLLIAARLMDTASNAFIQIGRTNIGTFEPALLMALAAVFVQVLRGRQKVFFDWPWRLPWFLFVGFAGLSIAWSANRSDGISEVISTLVVTANIVIILSMVRTTGDFLAVVYTWLAACVMIGVITTLGDALGFGSSGPWEAAAGGGRETGLGQQPNWYAMNLMFIVHTAFGMAITQKRALYRWGLVAAGLFVFFNLMRSGSRGGAYSLVIGGAAISLVLPVFRKWFLRFIGVMGVLFLVLLSYDMGAVSKAYFRIWNALDQGVSYIRHLNWLTCVDMFLDTWGRGIGAGGYQDLLEHYNLKLFNSVYRYPHGIFWGLLAHYGVIGLLLAGWLVGILTKMVLDLTKWTKGSFLEIYAWTMPAAMLSYFAWSFVEFEYNEKPFWEWFTVYTALYLLVKRMVDKGESLPPMPGGVFIPWRKTKDGSEANASP